MFAVIETGGKQYLVTPNTKIKIEKLPVQEGQEVVFDKVLLLGKDGSEIEIGKPYLKGTQVVGRVARRARDKKIRIFKYRAKVRYRRRKGHRQHFTEVEILKI